MTRRPDAYTGAGTAVRGDVADRTSLDAALAGCDAAYYLVHSLEQADFASRDAEAARSFAAAASAAGLGRIVYLGGLGDDADDLSEHLRSRRQVEEILGSTGIPVTTLRAGIVIGHGGISWEMTRQLVEHLPAMICPRWCTPAPSRSPSTTWCATSSRCSRWRRPRAGPSTSEAPTSSPTWT